MFFSKVLQQDTNIFFLYVSFVPSWNDPLFLNYMETEMQLGSSHPWIQNAGEKMLGKKM